MSRFIPSFRVIRQLAAQQDYDAIAIGGIVELDDAKTYAITVVLQVCCMVVIIIFLL